MPDSKPEFMLYACFAINKEAEIWGNLVVASKKEEIYKWQSERKKRDSKKGSPEPEPPTQEKTEENDEQKGAPEPPIEFSALMKKFQEAMSSGRMVRIMKAF